MTCQVCQKNPASVHIVEVVDYPEARDRGTYKVDQKHMCDQCAQMLNLPHTPVVKKSVMDIWKLLQQSARRSRQAADLTCPDCGMSLKEFRARGRLGCPRDYEVFQKHLDPLLQRIHNARQHVGRVPGLDEEQIDRLQQIHELRERLEAAIRDEEYEDAARLRDELQELENAAEA